MKEARLQQFLKEKINILLEFDDDIFQKTYLSPLKLFYYILLFAKNEKLKIDYSHSLKIASISEIVKMFIY